MSRVLRLHCPVRLLFLIRTSGDHMTRPLDTSALDTQICHSQVLLSLALLRRIKRHSSPTSSPLICARDNEHINRELEVDVCMSLNSTIQS